MKRLRVVVAEEHPILRLQIVAFLYHQSEVTIVGEAADGLEALRCVDELDPDVLILNLTLPIMDGWEVLRQLQQRQARVKVIILSAFADSSRATAEQFHCVADYINKDNPTRLARAMRELARKLNPITPILH